VEKPIHLERRDSQIRDSLIIRYSVFGICAAPVRSITEQEQEQKEMITLSV
jgi:hypothetical protein